MKKRDIFDAIRKMGSRFPKLEVTDIPSFKKNQENIAVRPEPKIQRIDGSESFISSVINNMIDDIAKQQRDFYDSSLKDMLHNYGVADSEIQERVSGFTVRAVGEGVNSDMTHVYIDNQYAFSLSKGYNFSISGTTITSWIRPEYILEMSKGDF